MQARCVVKFKALISLQLTKRNLIKRTHFALLPTSHWALRFYIPCVLYIFFFSKILTKNFFFIKFQMRKNTPKPKSNIVLNVKENLKQ